MENNNVMVEEGISLLDIVKLLWSRVKLLILVVILGGIIGGGITAIRTVDVNYYGSTVEFYVNPEKPEDAPSGESQYSVYGAYGSHVMKTIIQLLESDSFAEKLILNGDRLPKKGVWVNKENPKEVALDLDGLIDVATAELKAEDDAKANADAKVLLSEEALALLEETWTSALSTNTKYAGLAYSDSAYKKLVSELDELKNNTALQSAYENYEGVDGAKAQARKALDEAKIAREKAEKAVNSTLLAWQQTAKYRSALAQFKSALSYSFLQEDASAENVNNLARSFIYVKISVLNDEAFANEVLRRVRGAVETDENGNEIVTESVVSKYIEENMTIPAGYQGTNCQRITRTDDIYLTNPKYATKQAVKYGLLVGAIALVVASIVILLVDRLDKRLRDPEIITKKFNVPLLGVVPTIEDLAIDGKDKKKNEKEEK